MVISFDNFRPNATNPEFRDCNVHIDVLCHTDYWDLGSFRLRPLKICGYIDGILNKARLSGIGQFLFAGCNELILDEPEIVKQGTKYGVKLKASAPSIHMIRADIETEVSPIVGSEKQSEELVNYLLSEFENDPIKIWESNIFGKNLHELVNEGLQNKLSRMPEDAQGKLQETLERIVNEGSGGLICIIL